MSAVRAQVTAALHHLSLSTRGACVRDGLASCLSAARKALFIAQEAQFAEALLPTLYFSLEFKTAVYLPVLLPTLVPIFGLLAAYKRAWRSTLHKSFALSQTSASTMLKQKVS